MISRPSRQAPRQNPSCAGNREMTRSWHLPLHSPGGLWNREALFSRVNTKTAGKRMWLNHSWPRQKHPLDPERPHGHQPVASTVLGLFTGQVRRTPCFPFLGKVKAAFRRRPEMLNWWVEAQGSKGPARSGTKQSNAGEGEGGEPPCIPPSPSQSQSHIAFQSPQGSWKTNCRQPSKQISANRKRPAQRQLAGCSSLGVVRVVSHPLCVCPTTKAPSLVSSKRHRWARGVRRGSVTAGMSE